MRDGNPQTGPGAAPPPPAQATPRPAPFVNPFRSGPTPFRHRPAGVLTQVIIRRSEMEAARQPGEAWQAIGAVVEFLNDMMLEGRYTPDEVPERAAGLYNADVYLEQVNNGGHAQFLFNCRLIPATFDRAMAGLEGMGATAHQAILRDCMEWARVNLPPEALRPAEELSEGSYEFLRTHFFTPLLEKLDERFFALEEEQPMAGLALKWLETWPELTLVEDEDYEHAIKAVVALNPERERRISVSELAALRMATTNPTMLAIATLAASWSEGVISLGQGSDIELDDAPGMQFDVETSSGQRCLQMADHVAVLAQRDLVAEALHLLAPRVGIALPEWIAFLNGSDENEERASQWAIFPQSGQFAGVRLILLIDEDGAGLWLVNKSDADGEEPEALAVADHREVMQHRDMIERAGLARAA